jgi:hypothetical protein
MSFTSIKIASYPYAFCTGRFSIPDSLTLKALFSHCEEHNTNISADVNFQKLEIRCLKDLPEANSVFELVSSVETKALCQQFPGREDIELDGTFDGGGSHLLLHMVSCDTIKIFLTQAMLGNIVF